MSKGKRGKRKNPNARNPPEASRPLAIPSARLQPVARWQRFQRYVWDKKP